MEPSPIGNVQVQNSSVRCVDGLARLVRVACYSENVRNCGEHTMGRLTINLDDDLHRALKEAAARQSRSLASIIEESLRLRGIQDQAGARALIAQARTRVQMDPDEATALAADETQTVRKR